MCGLIVLIICPVNNLVIDVSLFLSSINTCEVALSHWKYTIDIFVFPYMHDGKIKACYSARFLISHPAHKNTWRNCSRWRQVMELLKFLNGYNRRYPKSKKMRNTTFGREVCCFCCFVSFLCFLLLPSFGLLVPCFFSFRIPFCFISSAFECISLYRHLVVVLYYAHITFHSPLVSRFHQFEWSVKTFQFLYPLSFIIQLS